MEACERGDVHVLSRSVNWKWGLEMDLSHTGTMECRSYPNFSKVKRRVPCCFRVFSTFFFKVFSLFLFQRKNDVVRTF